MTVSEPPNRRDRHWLTPWPLVAIASAALLAGLYARFKGLGTGALGVDEFYISRSIDNVLRSGLPEYQCGGYYLRGLLYQYLVAALRLIGLTPELAGRLVTALSSLAVLPAAWLMGRRIHGTAVGWLVVIVLALSVWEVEMARFARMYVPFQAIFTWYLVFFLRYTVDKERSALWWMLGLSTLGVLVWEGGVLLALLNLLPPLLNHDNGRIRRKDWLYFGGTLSLFVLLYLFVNVDARGMNDPTALPPDHNLTLPASNSTLPRTLWVALLGHPGWLLSALAPIGLAIASLPWMWKLRTRWLAASGLLVALLAALLHQFLICGSVLTLLLLTQIIDLRELASRPARLFLLSIAASACFWLVFGLSTTDWHSGSSAASGRALALGYLFLGFPSVIMEIGRPWGRTLPLLSTALVILITGFGIREILLRRESTGTERSLLVVLVLMILAIGASAPARDETRYAFFLYPLAIALAIGALAALSERFLLAQRAAVAAATAASLALFTLTEDFQPRHLASIDHRETNLRLGLSVAQKAHYYPRTDIRGAAEWLEEHVEPGDIVVSGIPNLDAYYSDVDYFFLDEQDSRFRAYACQNGTLDRWTNRPLLHDANALAAMASKGSRTFVVAFPTPAQRLGSEVVSLRTWQLRPVWTSIDGQINVFMLTSS